MGIATNKEVTVGSRKGSRGVVRTNSPSSRREFLKRAAQSVGAWVALRALEGKGAYDLGKEAEAKTLDAYSDISGKVDSFLHGVDKEGQGSEVEIDEIAQRALVQTEIDLAYPNLNIRDRKNFVDKLAKVKAAIDADITSEVVDRVFVNEAKIRSFAKAQGVPEDLLLGLVVWESKGDERAISSAGAKGLTQMMDLMAQKYKLKITDGVDDERFIPLKILPATAQELKKQFGNFGDWGLAVWSWHAGQDRVYAAVKKYLDGKGKEIDDINVQVKDDSDKAKAEATAEAVRRKDVYRSTIQNEGINLYKLFQSADVLQMFTGTQWDKTDEYVPRVIASSRVYKDQKELLGLAS